MRGRKAVPTRVKELTGNPGKRAIPKGEIQPKPGIPPCPEWLDAAAKAMWRKLAPELDRLGILTVVDQGALAGYCQAWSEVRSATETLTKEGRTVSRPVMDAEGNVTGRLVKPHPAVNQQRTALATLRHFSAMFGLDPSSRARINLGLPAEEGAPETPAEKSLRPYSEDEEAVG